MGRYTTFMKPWVYGHHWNTQTKVQGSVWLLRFGGGGSGGGVGGGYECVCAGLEECMSLVYKIEKQSVHIRD